MIDKLSGDLVWYLSSFLSVSDSLKLGNEITDYYQPKTVVIQRWYRKYKKVRDLRYKILKNEFLINNKKICTCINLNIWFILHDFSKLKIKLNEYLAESCLKFYLRHFERTYKEEILNNFLKTKKEFTYYNIKSYLRMLPIEMLIQY